MPRDDHFQDVSINGNISPSDTTRVLNDLVPSPDNDQDLGKATERWRNGFFGGSTTVDGTATFNGAAVFNGGITSSSGGLLPSGTYIFPGLISGLVPPATTAPGSTVVLSGGSIADGTYYFKTTYVNDNGETTGSLTKTVTVSGGGGASTVYIGNPGAPLNYLGGAWGYNTYASSDNATFYLQTPNPVTADFMVTATAHYPGMGPRGSKLTSLTLSGTQIPTTNTAVIDPLQVALNATIRQSDWNLQLSTVVVPAGTTTLTTPLILPINARLLGISAIGSAKNGTAASRIYYAGANAKKAAVMVPGAGRSSIENVYIESAGHAVLMFAGVGTQGDNFNASDSSFRSDDATNTYAALKIVGIWYNINFERVHLRGGVANVQATNASGANWKFSDTRWDIGGPSAFQSVPGWMDPDDGLPNVSFPFGAGPIFLKGIQTESGTGIMWDMVGMSPIFEDLNIADPAPAAATDSTAKFGSNTTYSTAVSTVKLRDSTFYASGNQRVGTNWVGAAGSIYLEGNSSLGAGSSAGTNYSLDANNIQAMQIVDASAGQSFSWDTNAPAGTSRPVNLHSSTRLLSLGAGGTGNNELAMAEFIGRVRVSRKNGTAYDRATFWELANDATTGSGFEVRRWTDAASIFTIPQADASSFALLRNNLRIMATGGGTPQLLIGPSTGTPTVGASALGLTSQAVVAARNAAGTGDVNLFRSSATDLFEFLATTTSALQHRSTLATGTAPFVVASTTKVANLNADLLDDKDWASPAAIGTGTPAAGTFTTLTTAAFTTGSIGGAALLAGACASGTVAVVGVSSADVVMATPVTYPGDGNYWMAYMSAADTVTVKVCAAVAGTPTASNYNVRIVK